MQSPHLLTGRRVEAVRLARGIEARRDSVALARVAAARFEPARERWEAVAAWIGVPVRFFSVGGERWW